MNGDGLADIIVGAFKADGLSGESYVIFGKAGAAAVDLADVAAGAGGGFVINGIDRGDYSGASVSVAGDVNGDGLADVIVGAFNADPSGDSNAGDAHVVFGKAGTAAVDLAVVAAGAGGFVINGIDPEDRSGRSVSGAGDVNGDGLADLLVGAPRADPGGDGDAGETYVVFGKAGTAAVELADVAAGTGGFVINGIDPGDLSANSVSGAGDVNGDGLADLIVAAYQADPGGDTAAGESYVVFAPPTILFDPPSEVIATGAGDFVAIGDLDTDGDEDAVIVVPGDDPGVNGDIQVFLNQGSDGNGGWLGLVDQPAIEVGRQPSGVAVGFLDADLHLDIAVANAGDDNVSILINAGAGDGSFDAPVDFAITGLEPVSIAAADFTGDGITDLATANAGDDTVGFIVNLGGAIFFNDQNVSLPGTPTAIEPENVDDDKDKDCLVTIGLTDQVVVIENLGGGMFDATPIELAVGDAPVDLASGDLDANGFPDIATADGGASTVSIILNDGALVFDASFPVLVGASPQSVQLVDMDNDTDLDLVVVADDFVIGPAVQILENFGAPLALGGAPIAFGPPASFNVGANPNYVVSADLDGDELNDLVTANEDPADPANGSVSVLLNLPCPGDIDSSGDVGFGDMTLLLLNWGPCPAPPANCPWDLDHNGVVVGFSDVTLLLLAWGPCK